MNIAIIGTRGYPYVYSGYETFVSELAPRLVARGHAVTVYCHRQMFAKRPEMVNGVQLVYIPVIQKKIFSQLSGSFLATIHLLSRQYDVVLYVNSANGPFGYIAGLGGAKTAINVDGLEWLRPKWKGFGAMYFRMASSLATKSFDTVITDSERMAEIYENEFQAQSTTIPYGANLEKSEKPELLTQFDLQADNYYLIVGRLIPDNNADIIVQGFAETRGDRKLVIVGDVPYNDDYAARVRSTNDKRVVFTGYIRDSSVLRELYCNSYVYLHGHEFGGTNPSLLSALGCGCCVLALDTQFNREVLKDETHGFFFRKEPGDIREKIEMLEKDLVSVLAKRKTARTRIEGHYTWEKITDQYESLFRKISA